MDISKIKDVVGKLSFFRDYSSLLLPVIIMVVSILFLIVGSIMGGKLKERIERDSISSGKRLKSLGRGTVARNQWKIEKTYQEAYEADANQISLFAKQSTQRNLLSYKIFPEPVDTSTLIFEEFGKIFRDKINGLLVSVNARECPTEAELTRSIRKTSFSSGRGRRKKGNVDATIQDVLCLEKAESAFVYTNPDDLAGYKFWGEYIYSGIEDGISKCWYWQLGYWIIEDVIDTIGILNTGTENVFTSPVKRLVSVKFTSSNRRSRSKNKNASGKPVYVLSAEDGFTESYTRRLTNDAVDIVHFKIGVIVSIKTVLPFMHQLCSAKEHKYNDFSNNTQEQVFKHNQITILESNIRFVNRESGAHSLYRYGEDALVKLDLTCEYIFNRESYEEIKPAVVKNSIKKIKDEINSKKRGRRGRRR